MRFKTGIVVGFATGYVMGTKAGRYRYDQIMKVVGRLWESAPAGKARAQASRLVDEATDRFRNGAHNGSEARAVTLP